MINGLLVGTLLIRRSEWLAICVASGASMATGLLDTHRFSFFIRSASAGTRWKLPAVPVKPRLLLPHEEADQLSIAPTMAGSHGCVWVPSVGPYNHRFVLEHHDPAWCVLQMIGSQCTIFMAPCCQHILLPRVQDSSWTRLLTCIATTAAATT
jgi:hypothetical protein